MLFMLTLMIFLFLDLVGKEAPLLKVSEIGSSLFDKPSPHDHISENNIEVYNDRVVIYVQDARISSYLPTKSMDPTIDVGANGIEIPVTSTDQIYVGDIISFKEEDESNLIVHRVIEIGYDKKVGIA